MPEDILLEGTVKLHGAHADIVSLNTTTTDAKNEDCVISMDVSDFEKNAESILSNTHVQSRNRVISLKEDNSGCFVYWSKIKTDVKKDLIRQILTKYSDENNLHGLATELGIAMEFCGGSIQKGVGICKLPKMLVIVNIAVNGKWLKDMKPYRNIQFPDSKIYNIYKSDKCVFEHRFKLNLDAPEETYNALEVMTLEVERECPFAKSLGVENGVGEGIVWKVLEPVELARSSFWFKVKGDKHARGGGGKKGQKAPPAEKTDEEKDSIFKCRDMAMEFVSDGRKSQGFEYMREMNHEITNKNIGIYLKWLVNDIIREEAVTIEEQKLDLTCLKVQIKQIARDWFIQNHQKMND